MESELELVDQISKQLVNKEKIINDISVLNNELTDQDDLIVYLNIRSISANFAKLQIFIETLKTKPLCIVCVETWNIEHENFFVLPGYKMYYNNSVINQNDGVVTYFLDEVIEETEIVSIDHLKILNTKIRMKDGNFSEISALYRSHDISKTEFIKSINNFLFNKRFKKNHFIIGDFNIDLLKLDLLSQEFLNNFLEHGYIPGYTMITRPATNNTDGTCIDNVFYRSEKLTTKNYTYTNSITDHFILITKINKQIIKIDQGLKSTINYKLLKRNAGNINWELIYDISDPNLAAEFLIDNINQCITKSTTIVNLTSRKKQVWITKALIKSCQTKEKLYLALRKNPSNEMLKNEYKNYVKVLNKVIDEAKNTHEKEYIEKNINNKKKLWDIINEKVSKKSKKKDTIKYIIDSENNKIEDEKIIAEKMNEYFCSIGQHLRNKITQPPNASTSMPQRNPKTMFFRPTNCSEIADIIKNLKVKGGGVDKINTKSIKAISLYIVNPLCYLINLCIELSVFPIAFKKAAVVPIHKSSKKCLMTNYRPISLISNLAKIFERVIHNRISNFIFESNIISENQFGFIKNRGTSNALNFLSDFLYSNLDKSKPTIVAFIDLAKAFDTVDHSILLDKLSYMGIRGNVLELIKSYLTDRFQMVRIGNTNSSYKLIDIGVPQGTILGPLLFILYINDLLCQMPKDTILSYADDTALLSGADSWCEAKDRISRKLNEVSIWMALNKLSLNVDKTVFMSFGNYKDSVPLEFELSINGKELQRVTHTKYLGLMFDYNMKWKEHIDYIINKTKYLVYVFYKLAKTMSSDTLLLIYYAFFHSIATYGIIAWGSAYANCLNQLQALQNKILKIISKNTFLNVNRPLNIKTAYELECLLYHYQSLKEKYCKSKSVTRMKILVQPKNTLSVGSKNSYSTAIKLFNLLPNERKTLSTSKNNIKTKLKEWLLST